MAGQNSEKKDYEAQVRNSRILIVDDLIANVSLLDSILTRLSYKQLKSVTDSREVFPAVEQWQPDLIILDLAMPRINGFKIMEQLRGNVPKEQRIPILVLTADTDPGTKRRALAAGATEFLPKPFDSSELLLRIRNLLLMRLFYNELRNHNHILEEKVAQRTQSLFERSLELEQALAELKRTQHQVVQQERFRAFAEMAGGITHDFNNTLMCMIGYTDLMINSPEVLDERATALKFLQTMNTAGRDASKIVARLREFYRPRQEDEIFTSINVKTLMEEVVSLTQPKWKNKALSSGRVIEVKLDLHDVPLVACNAAEIREALVNLIFNAVDAMPQGGTLTLHTRYTDQRIRIGVSDTGTGMTEEVRQRCMEPFFSTKGDDGTGLGLAMVFGIVKRHESLVEIESELDKGTTFWITFGAQAEELEPAADENVRMDRPLHILAVDDEAMARDIVSRYLHADGHTVVTAKNGIEALERFESESFDLVITDYAMPGITGSQLAAAIRAKVANQPILLFTGCSDPSLTTDDLHPDIDIIMSKAISQREMRLALVKTMQRAASLFQAASPQSA